MAAAVTAAHRASWGRVLAGTMRLARDLDVAEEATADAFALALEAWTESGVPISVEAWLLTVARRRAIDRIRRAETLRRKLSEILPENSHEPGADAGLDAPPLGDEELRLAALCAHPALDPDAQLALTLRLACGVSTEAVAAAFLVRVPTMAARLTRAKRRIARSSVSVDLPDAAAVDERLPAVRRAVHLAYCLGHTAAVGSRLRDDALAERAVHLASALHHARSDDPEGAGLLALLLTAQARGAARLDPDGDQVLLDDMDDSVWDGAALADARQHLERAWRRAVEPGPMLLRAVIAVERSRRHETDWDRLVALYGQLLVLDPSATTALGRCEAIARRDGPAVGLRDLDQVLALGGLERYPYAAALRADLLGRLGRTPEARREWVRAASCARTDAEREWFSTRAAL